MRSLPRRILSPTALGFALLDVPLQAIQGLLYDFEQRTWPTNVDLMDTMLADLPGHRRFTGLAQRFPGGVGGGEPGFFLAMLQEVFIPGGCDTAVARKFMKPGAR
jgi:hypothetical protein